MKKKWFLILPVMAGIILFIIFIVPSFFHKTNHTGTASPVGSLHYIRSAEGMYKEKNGVYGTLKQLGDSGLLTDESIVSGHKGDSTITLHASDNSFFIITIPDDPTCSFYFMNEFGQIYIKRPGSKEFEPYDG